MNKNDSIMLNTEMKRESLVVLPGTLILKMWALGDSSQSMRAVDPDHSWKIGGLKKKRLKGYPKNASAMVLFC